MKKFRLFLICICGAVMAAEPPLRDLDADFADGAGYADEAWKVSVYPAKTTGYDPAGLKFPERLGRGVIAVRAGEAESFVTWRYLTDDPLDVTFNVYAGATLVTNTTLTNCRAPYGTPDESGGRLAEATEYTVVALTNGVEKDRGVWTVPASAPPGYVEIPLPEAPAATTTRTNGTLLAQWQNLAITYAPGDCSAGDLDGDGELELVVKWNPSRAQDNTGRGDTGATYYEGLKLDGTSLWRISTGPNIRSGEHYSPFLVWDFDGDGKAELVVKTSDGAVDARGKIIGHAVFDDPYDYPSQGNAYDYRDESGQILTGSEYLTVFSGETGEELQSVRYFPVRGSYVSGAQDYWGDNWGNRSERYLAAVAYLDGTNACAVMCRGYYARTAMTAWRWNGRNLSPVWAFDTTNTVEEAYRSGSPGDYAGQGFHSLRVADVDFDGKDEIIYGSMTVDHDGKGLYSTKQGHGDAQHLVQMDSARRGLQLFTCLESSGYGLMLHDLHDGAVIWRKTAGSDTGRCMALAADTRYRGFQYWGANAMGVFDNAGKAIYAAYVNKSYVHSMSMAVWWGPDLARWSLPGTEVRYWDESVNREVASQKFEGVHTINSTKSTPCISGDLYGDWREEVVLPTDDNLALRLYISTNATPYKFHTFLQDVPYRLSIATEQNGYNQPPWPGFYFGPDLHGHDMTFRGQKL